MVEHVFAIVVHCTVELGPRFVQSRKKEFVYDL